MKTIKEESLRWDCEDSYYNHDVRNAFRGGVAFAQQWISVKDELPEEGVDVLLKGNFNRFKKGNLEEYQIHIGKRLNVNFFTHCGVHIPAPTHWRPIELE